MSQYECINPDDFLQTPTGRVWTPERNREAWKQAYASLRAALEAQPCKPPRLFIVCGLQGSGKSTWIAQNAGRYAPCVLFDAALPRVIHRAPVIELGRQADARISLVWIGAPLEVALQRNAARREDERVPESAIRSVAEQFEAPRVTEGVHEVVHVRSVVDSGTEAQRVDSRSTIGGSASNSRS